MRPFAKLLTALPASLTRVLASALLLLAAGAVGAQTITTWVSNTSAFGPGSLLAAIQGLQPGYAGLQEIRFNFPVSNPPGASNVIFLNQPMPGIVGPNVRINGVDIAAGVIIDGNGHQPFTVAATSTTQFLELRFLTVRRGGSIDNGGCVAVRRAATELTLNWVQVLDCSVYLQSAATAARGGAVYAAGPLFVLDSVLRGNQILSEAAVPVASSNAIGGAIYKEGAHSLSIQRSLFQNNRVYLNNSLGSLCNSGHGGALGLNLPGSGFTATIIDSSFIDNGTPCRNPTVNFDLAGQGDGGALVYFGNGANQLQLLNNYFGGNNGRVGGGVGVIQALNTVVIASNNTFYANSASTAGGGLALENCCSASLSHNTFSDNIAQASGQASQLWLSVFALPALNHNLINGASPACNSSLAASQNGVAGFNLYHGGSCLIANDSGSGLVGYMFWLAAPALNGGLAPSMHPAYGSPAIDAGNPAGCANYDARYVIRPVDGDGDGSARCDIGAIESTVVDALFANGFE